MNRSGTNDGRPDPTARQHELVSIVVEHDDKADECTVFNPDTTGVDRMSSWITTEVESLVDLRSIR